MGMEMHQAVPAAPNSSPWESVGLGGSHGGDPTAPGLLLAPRPPAWQQPLTGRGELGGGAAAPPITTAYPEVYYYTNVNSRTGIWGAAAGS